LPALLGRPPLVGCSVLLVGEWSNVAFSAN
jgi:hypothetical protein